MRRVILAAANPLSLETRVMRRFSTLMGESRRALAIKVMDPELAPLEGMDPVMKSYEDFAHGLKCRIDSLDEDGLHRSRARQTIIERYYKAALAIELEVITAKHKPVSSCCDGKVKLFMVESATEKAEGSMVIATIGGIPAGRMFIARAPQKDHLSIFQAHAPLLKESGVDMSEMLANMVELHCRKKDFDPQRRLRASCVGIYKRELDSLTNKTFAQRCMVFSPMSDGRRAEHEEEVVDYGVRESFKMEDFRALAAARLIEASERKPRASTAPAQGVKLLPEGERLI